MAISRPSVSSHPPRRGPADRNAKRKYNDGGGGVVDGEMDGSGGVEDQDEDEEGINGKSDKSGESWKSREGKMERERRRNKRARLAESGDERQGGAGEGGGRMRSDAGEEMQGVEYTTPALARCVSTSPPSSCFPPESPPTVSLASALAPTPTLIVTLPLPPRLRKATPECGSRTGGGGASGRASASTVDASSNDVYASSSTAHASSNTVSASPSPFAPPRRRKGLYMRAANYAELEEDGRHSAGLGANILALPVRLARNVNHNGGGEKEGEEETPSEHSEYSASTLAEDDFSEGTLEEEGDSGLRERSGEGDDGDDGDDGEGLDREDEDGEPDEDEDEDDHEDKEKSDADSANSDPDSDSDANSDPDSVSEWIAYEDEYKCGLRQMCYLEAKRRRHEGGRFMSCYLEERRRKHESDL